MPKVIVALIAAAFAVVIGFFCGAMLSKPNIEATEAKIKIVGDSRKEAGKKMEQFKEKLEAAEDDNKRILKKLELLEQENEKILQQIAPLQNENTLLKERVSELKEIKDKLIEKALR